MTYIYGPVMSRRMGSSLGIDIIPKLTCTFECVYCQIGRKHHHVLNSDGLDLPESKKIIEEVRGFLSENKDVDYLTLSGTGEPTLNSNLSDLVDSLREFRIPIALITNSSLLKYENIMEGAIKCDLVMPSLDAPDQKTFEKINWPKKGILLSDIVDSLEELTKKAQGKIWLEIMFVKGNITNTSNESIQNLIKHVNNILPDKVHLNTCVRPPNEIGIDPLTQDELNDIKEKFEKKVDPKVKIEVVPESIKTRSISLNDSYIKSIRSMLRIRPSSLQDLAYSFSISLNEVTKFLGVINRLENLKMRKRDNKTFYFIE